MTSRISSIFRLDHALIPLARFAQGKGDVFLHRHGIEERAGLKKNPDFAPDAGQLALAQADDVLPVDPDFALVRLHQADEIFQEHALPASAPADDDKCLAVRTLISTPRRISCVPIRFFNPRTAIMERVEIER